MDTAAKGLKNKLYKSVLEVVPIWLPQQLRLNLANSTVDRKHVNWHEWENVHFNYFLPTLKLIKLYCYCGNSSVLWCSAIRLGFLSRDWQLSLYQGSGRCSSYANRMRRLNSHVTKNTCVHLSKGDFFKGCFSPRFSCLKQKGDDLCL